MVAEQTTPAHVDPINSQDVEPTRPEFVSLDTLPTVILSINSLLLDMPARQGGENPEHTRVLAESEERLPPIVVHGSSMRVIDGIHRVRAAIMLGKKEIPGKIYHGTRDDAFVLAVRMNTVHGLPLTRSDRTAATVRILQSHPDWSDRKIATAVGLSAGTVAKVRQRSTAQNMQSTRLGKDGRVRPVNHTASREKVAALLADSPTSPIRTIAQQAGVSPSTVHQVRQRLRASQPPSPGHDTVAQLPETPQQIDSYPSPTSAYGRALTTRVDIAAILDELKKDSSLAEEISQSLVRYLARYRVEIPGIIEIIKRVPPRHAGMVAQIAREYARVWTRIATHLEQRAVQPASTTTALHLNTQPY
jgi:ParB-like chromosome segregation protein Spo0J